MLFPQLVIYGLLAIVGWQFALSPLLRKWNHRQYKHQLENALEANAAQVPADAVIKPKRMYMRQVDSAGVVLDSKDKAVPVTDDQGKRRYMDYYLINDLNLDPDEPTVSLYDENGKRIRPTQVLYKSNSYDRPDEKIRRRHAALDLITDDNWEQIVSPFANGIPRTAAWIEFLDLVHRSKDFKNLVCKRDNKTIGEPALSWVDNGGTGKVIFLAVLSTGELLYPVQDKFSLSWEVMTIEEAINNLKQLAVPQQQP